MAGQQAGRRRALEQFRAPPSRARGGCRSPPGAQRHPPPKRTESQSDHVPTEPNGVAGAPNGNLGGGNVHFSDLANGIPDASIQTCCEVVEGKVADKDG